MRKWIIGGVLLGLAVLIAAALRQQPVEVEVSSVERTPLAVVLREEGETRVRDRYAISAPVSGRVQRIELDPGDRVKANESVLARFLPADPTPLDARSQAEASASVRASQSELGRAEADLGRVQSELRFAQSERERTRRLSADGVVSSEDLERAELAFETKEDGVRAAEFAVATARGQLQMTQARLVQSGGSGVGSNRSSSSSRGRAMDIVSPVDGVVLRRLRESEAVVGQGELIIEVGDPESLEVISDYLSSDAVRISAGQRAQLVDWGGPPLVARVQRVEPSGFTKISALGVEEQRVNVILDLEPGQPQARELGDAFRVEVAVTIWESENELTVDNGALFRRGESWAVFVLDQGEVNEVAVEIGQRGARRSQVVSGLEENAVVVNYPPSSLNPGDRAKPVSEGT